MLNLNYFVVAVACLCCTYLVESEEVLTTSRYSKSHQMEKYSTSTQSTKPKPLLDLESKYKNLFLNCLNNNQRNKLLELLFHSVYLRKI